MKKVFKNNATYNAGIRKIRVICSIGKIARNTFLLVKSLAFIFKRLRINFRSCHKIARFYLKGLESTSVSVMSVQVSPERAGPAARPLSMWKRNRREAEWLGNFQRKQPEGDSSRRTLKTECQYHRAVQTHRATKCRRDTLLLGDGNKNDHLLDGQQLYRH